MQAIEAGLHLIEAGLLELDAERKQIEARVELAKAAQALENIGDHEGAADVLSRVEGMRARANAELERAKGQPWEAVR